VTILIMGARLHNLFSLAEIKRKMERMSTTAIQTENAFETTTNAVIIYDTFAFAAKAKAMLDRAAHRTGDIMRWSVKPWRVDMLKVPLAADTALAEAAEAHLIVLAVRQVQSLFPWLANWLERWARCRRVREAGLAVWDGGNADTRSAQATPELSQFARRHGLGLISDTHALLEDTSPMFASDLHKREVSLTPTLQHILERPVRDNYQHWGINE